MRFVCNMFLLFVPPVIPGHSAEGNQGSETAADDASLWSGETEADEGLDVSQQMMESLLLGAETQLENEEHLMGISSRLQTALEKMLMAITDTSNQVQTWFKFPGTNVAFNVCSYSEHCSTCSLYFLVLLRMALSAR